MTAPITDALQLERPLADGLLSVFRPWRKAGFARLIRHLSMTSPSAW